MVRKKKRRVVRAALEFALKELKIRIAPQVIFCKNIQDMCGIYSMRVLGAYDWKINKITINRNLSFTDTVGTLLHELVHAKQYQEGWVKQDGNKIYWKKKKIDTNTKFYSTGTAIIARGAEQKVLKHKTAFDLYFRAPHEIQARDLSKSLLKKFQNSEKHEKNQPAWL